MKSHDRTYTHVYVYVYILCIYIYIYVYIYVYMISRGLYNGRCRNLLGSELSCDAHTHAHAQDKLYNGHDTIDEDPRDFLGMTPST